MIKWIRVKARLLSMSPEDAAFVVMEMIGSDEELLMHPRALVLINLCKEILDGRIGGAEDPSPANG